uniref:WAT1-related protein At4g08290-like n=1 Tax=Nicotiana tabacum TaxID=4097 RepID=A0A1S3ZBW5_TOBAC|nr:PREDICTED: WAT1-related protein At4g08290-like [Nicotiana tabacum]
MQKDKAKDNYSFGVADICTLSTGLEDANIRDIPGIAKILGTMVSLVGVMTMKIYKGPVVKNLGLTLIYIDRGNGVVHSNWLKGSILTAASCITWSIWYIMQAYTLRGYPAQLSLTTWMSFIGATQSGFYTEIVVSGLVVYMQLWCTEQKGPIFAMVFNPLSTILVAVLAYFVLGEKLYTGSENSGSATGLCPSYGEKQHDFHT